MKNFKIGDVVYLYKNQSTLYQISGIETENDKTYYWLKRDLDSPIAERLHERFIHLATNEKDIEKYLYYQSPEFKVKMKNAIEEADKWLAERQEALKGLSFRFFETNLWPEQKTLLEENGYFCYDLRDWDEGSGYNIEKSAFVNRIGNWVTDMALTPYMNEGTWIGIDELELATLIPLPYEEIADLLSKGEKMHFAERNGGSLDDKINSLREVMEELVEIEANTYENADKDRDITD